MVDIELNNFPAEKKELIQVSLKKGPPCVEGLNKTENTR